MMPNIGHIVSGGLQLAGICGIIGTDDGDRSPEELPHLKLELDLDPAAGT
jgi:hypothetical protein